MTADLPCTPGELAGGATLYVAGHSEIVGSAILRRLQVAGFEKVIGKTSDALDLRDRDAVFEFFAEAKPKYVVLAAARVGGILADSIYLADFYSDNIRIQVNVLDAARASERGAAAVPCSSCVCPKFAEQPIRKESLLTGHLEPTNDAYAIAKIAGILHVQAIRRQNGLPWISTMPTKLYGPTDDFSPTDWHVLPALIRRYDQAVTSRATTVTNGAPARPDVSSYTPTIWRRLPSPARSLRRPRPNQREQRYRRRDSGDRRDDCVYRRGTVD